MTEHQHHGGHQGGHEIDAPPTRELFNIVWGLGALTLLSLITCVQLFNDQARDIASERGKEGSALLAEYRKEMETRTRGAGTDEITDANGKVVARYSYIPLASARDLVLAKPEKLGAFPPPPGWMHPDDVARGGQGAAAPAPTPVPAAPGDAPAGAADPHAAPADPAAAGGAPEGAPAAPEGAPAAPADAKAEPAAPADAKAEPAAPADGKAEPAPADAKAEPAPAPAAPSH